MIKRLFYHLFRPVYQRAKQIVKKAALRILSKVDDAFLENYQSSSEPKLKNSAQTFASKKESPYSVSPTIVFNEGSSLSNLDSIRFIFDSIFQKKLSPALFNDLWHKVCQHPTECTSNEQLVVFLKKQIMNKLQANDMNLKDESEALEALSCITTHALETLKSKTAYLPSASTSKKMILWPDPTDAKDSRSLFEELPFSRSYPIMDKDTPIGSAGSCFAMEIAHRLQAANYHYVITEPYANEKNGYSNACARWGTIFNTPCFRQLVECAFSDRILPRVVWSSTHSGAKKYYDPFREDIAFESKEEYESSYLKHRAAARQALVETKVFVLTLGMNEVWHLKADGSVCSRSPWRLASYLVKPSVLTVDDNIKELQTMLNLWRIYNPDIQLILSVSPVPLHATFRGSEHHVITANCHSKSTLRVAAEIFSKNNRGVYYFPSYETVMYCTKDAWEADQRHVSKAAVDNVMKLFQKMFMKDNLSF